jgi:hypothetical protein
MLADTVEASRNESRTVKLQVAMGKPGCRQRIVRDFGTHSLFDLLNLEAPFIGEIKCRDDARSAPGSCRQADSAGHGPWCGLTLGG